MQRAEPLNPSHRSDAEWPFAVRLIAGGAFTFTLLVISAVTLTLFTAGALGVFSGRCEASSHLPRVAIAQAGGFGYALFLPDGNTLVENGDRDADPRLPDLPGRYGRPLLWVRLHDRSYVIRDARLLSAAHEIARAMLALGNLQRRLGERQSRLGDLQGMLGAEQGRLGDEQGRRSAMIVRASVHERDSESVRVQRAMDDLTRRQADLARRQQPLARRQAELGRQQAALGRAQVRASREARERLRALAERAIAEGAAERIE